MLQYTNDALESWPTVLQVAGVKRKLSFIKRTRWPNIKSGFSDGLVHGQFDSVPWFGGLGDASAGVCSFPKQNSGAAVKAGLQDFAGTVGSR